MALNPARVTAINTPVTGANGTKGISPGNDGLPGFAADEVISGDNFADPAAALDLFPKVTGGSGGPGADGVPGAIGMMTLVGNVEMWSQGGNGGTGGPGADGAVGALDMIGEAIGSAATAYGGAVDVDLTATGGAGGSGAAGGSGGSGGENNALASEVGAAGGSGGSGGNAGTGGRASATLDNDTAYSAAGAIYDVNAFGGAGGVEPAVSGSAGAMGGTASDGGNGGDGGSGGSATATISNDSLADALTISVSLLAVGGQGQYGGNGAEGGPGLTINAPPVPNDNRFGLNGFGGNGGNGGSAATVLTNTTFSAPLVALTVTDELPTGGLGGTGGSVNAVSTARNAIEANPPGANGTAGSYGTGTMTITGNTVTLGAGLPGGQLAPGTFTELTLTLGIRDLASPEPRIPAAEVPLNGGAGGNLIFSGNTLTGTGNSELFLQATGGGVGTVIDLMHNLLTIDGSAANTMTGFTTFDLDPNYKWIAGPGLNYQVYVHPDPDTIVYQPGAGNTTVHDANVAGDLDLEFNGFGAALNNLAQLQADTTVNGNVITIHAPGAGTLTIDSTTFTETTADTSFACYLEGTRIATGRGEVPIETLRPGDLVCCPLSGGFQPVVWLGHRTVQAGPAVSPAQFWPVLIKPHAFGRDLPLRALYLSPDHAIYINQVLIPVRLLVNGTTIAQEARSRATYWHVELAVHDVILAEGLPAESYLDVDDRGKFSGCNVVPISRREPALIWEAKGCARLVLTGPELDAARASLAAFAECAAA